jgi:hypothetical protein
MQDADLLLSLAGIAGVFVGFGALISSRDGGTSQVYEVTYIRGVVGMGLMVVVAAVAPVIISRYDISGRDLWLLSSLLYLVLFWGMIVGTSRNPEHDALLAAFPRAVRVRQQLLSALLVTSVSIVLILVVLGPFPDLEPALYLTAVAFVLFYAAFALLQLVMSQGRPQAA